MMKPMILLVALFAGVCPVSLADTTAPGTRYVLDLRDARDEGSNTIVSLRDKNRQHVLWTRKLYSPKITWSKDKLAVVVEGVWHFLVWREGDALRDFAVSGGDGGTVWDYTMGCVWSPNNRRLLIRFGTSAMSDSDAGSLFCLRIGQEKTYRYSHIAGNVREMKWHGNRTALYRGMERETFNTSRWWRKWRIR